LPEMTDDKVRGVVAALQSALDMARKEAEAQTKRFVNIAKDKSTLKWAAASLEMFAEKGFSGKKVVEAYYGSR
ncbi:hypothetical protein KEM55_008876, partial [Ascosphaera atra]